MIRGNILTIGLSTIELRITTPYSTGGNKKMLEADKYKFSAGGRGATTSIGISRLGWGSMLCTALGDDMFGSTYSRIFADERVESRYIKVCRNAQTAINFSFENKSGEIYIPSSSRFLNSTDIEASFNVMPDAVISTLELPLEVISTASRCAAGQNSKFILDATGARSEADISALKYADIVVLSDENLSVLTGIDVRTIDDRMNGCIRLNSKLKIGYTVIDMEEKGYYIYDGKYCNFIMPFDLPIVNVNGCREAFLSALTVSFLQTEDINNSVTFAAAASAIAGNREGGFESLPTEREIRELLKR
ncbi:MAG: carbohydrate kinase family protein [Clostridia bacterium]|nr:carbohydrate kinase family protein [Clostridia bacterium]